MFDDRVLNRILAKCAPGACGCLVFHGWRNERGYGKIRIQRKYYFVHRVMYMIYNQCELEPHNIVMHLCDNRACCNIEHLQLGTALDNTLDMVYKGRHRKDSSYNRLSKEEVVQIKIRLDHNHSVYSIAQSYGIPESTIRDIKTGKTWRKVEPLPKPTCSTCYAYDPLKDE